MATYNSETDLNLSHVPEGIEDPILYQELLAIHDAIEHLLTHSAKGYGGIKQNIPVVLPNITVSAQVVPANIAIVAEPRYIIQDFANDGIRFERSGVWMLNISIVLNHAESNSGRNLDIQLYDATNASEAGAAKIPIARNQPGTLASFNLMVEVPIETINDLYVIRLSSLDSITGVTLENFELSTFLVSSLV